MEEKIGNEKSIMREMIDESRFLEYNEYIIRLLDFCASRRKRMNIEKNLISININHIRYNSSKFEKEDSRLIIFYILIKSRDSLLI